MQVFLWQLSSKGDDSLGYTANGPLGPLTPAVGLVHAPPQLAQKREINGIVLVSVVVKHAVGVHIYHSTEQKFDAPRQIRHVGVVGEKAVRLVNFVELCGTPARPAATRPTRPRPAETWRGAG